ncbi:hypothetical protein HHK36_025852 [Tetracentron sinense]|uniref:Uncharacterized protein n=1 Tax=Tetracentron sinense TaxID=13715 RepID=A0A834YHN4_TETSI|nr:hypothetical protein HHK36_025852 [Tetracentron sinense]
MSLMRISLLQLVARLMRMKQMMNNSRQTPPHKQHNAFKNSYAEMVMFSTNEENPKLAKKAGGSTTKDGTPECEEKSEVKRDKHLLTSSTATLSRIVTAEMVMLSTNEENLKLTKKAGGSRTKNGTPECEEKSEVKRGENGSAFSNLHEKLVVDIKGNLKKGSTAS